MRLRLRLCEPEFRAAHVESLSHVELAKVDADTRRLVRHLTLLIERILRLGHFARLPVRDHHLVVLRRGGAVTLKSVRNCHAPLHRGLGRGRRSAIDQALEDRARLGMPTIEIEARRSADAVLLRRWRRTTLLGSGNINRPAERTASEQQRRAEANHGHWRLGLGKWRAPCRRRTRPYNRTRSGRRPVCAADSHFAPWPSCLAPSHSGDGISARRTAPAACASTRPASACR